jgi:hypothetical protein
MTEKIAFEDWSHRVYVCNRKDFDRMLHDHPKLKKRVCEVVTFYHSESYTALMQQVIGNGVLDEV